LGIRGQVEPAANRRVAIRYDKVAANYLAFQPRIKPDWLHANELTG
jgi:hypothetical protein